MQQELGNFIGNPESLPLLYGETFYMFPQDLGIADSPTESPKKDLPQVPKTRLEPVTDTPAKVEPKVEPKTEQKPAVAQLSDLPGIENIPGITWRKKPTSQVLFILREEEMKNTECTDLLKNIVKAIGLSFENTGFGIIKGPVSLQEFANMPNPYGIVFDNSIYTGTQNPAFFMENEVFFSHQLEKLANDKNLKLQLWNFLKELKDRIG
jgi:hypothetical protein